MAGSPGCHMVEYVTAKRVGVREILKIHCNRSPGLTSERPASKPEPAPAPDTSES